MTTITVSFSGSSKGSLTDLTEKLTVLKKNARQDSEYVSGIVLIKKKKKIESKSDSECVEKKTTIKWSFL